MLHIMIVKGFVRCMVIVLRLLILMFIAILHCVLVIASTFIIFWKINCFLSFSDICMYMYTCYFVFSLYAYILHPTLLLDNMLIKILYVIRAKHHHV